MKVAIHCSWLLLWISVLPTSGYAQTVIGMGTEDPNPNAVLELVPTNHNQGFLAPRLTSAQRTATSFAEALTNADNGLLVFDTDIGQFFYWYQGAWRTTTSNEPGGPSGRRGTSWFTGTTEPAGTDAEEGDFYINQSTGDIYRFDGSSFRSLGRLGSNNESGNETLTSVLTRDNRAGDQRIIDLKDPVDDQDAATKKYVDDRFDNISPVLSVVPNLSNVLSIGNDAGSRRIVNLDEPEDSQDAATKNYVDDQISGISTALPGTQNLKEVLVVGNDANFQKISNLALPTEARDAATKEYVDSRVNPSNVGLPSLPEGEVYVGNSSDQPNPVTITGDMTMAPDGTVTISNASITTAKIADDAVTRDKINANVAGSGLSQAGDGSLAVNLGANLSYDGDAIRVTGLEVGEIAIGQGVSNGIAGTIVSGDATLDRDGKLQVVGLQGRTVLDNAPSNGQVLTWNGSAWVPAASSGGTVTGGVWFTGNDAAGSGSSSEANDGDFYLRQYGNGDREVLVKEGTNWISMGYLSDSPGGGSVGNLNDGRRKNGLLNITQPPPGQREEGMLWLDQSANEGEGAIKIYNGDDWVEILGDD